MKRLLFLSMMLIMAIGVSAQPLIYSGTVSVQNTNGTTKYLYPLKPNGDTIIYGQIGIASYAMYTDSIAGGISGYMVLQGCLTANNGKWYNLDTMVFDGVHTRGQIINFDPQYYRRIRAQFTTLITGVTKGSLIHNWMSVVPN